MVRLLLTILVFVELTVLGALAAILALGSIPNQLPVLVWTLGIVLVMSAAIAVMMPEAWLEKGLLHGALVAGSVLFMLPFLWLISTSFKYPEETFIYPPRWVPEVPRRVISSPYVVESTADAPSEPIRRALWTQARPMVPASELAMVDESTAAEAMGRRLLQILNASGTPPTDDGTLARPLTQDFVTEAWLDTFRGLGFGKISVQDSLRRTTLIPREKVRWSFSPSAMVTEAMDGVLIAYDLSSNDEFEATTTIERATLPDTPAVVSLAMRQDRSWHRVRVSIQWNGATYESQDSLYLGSKGWVQWGFKLPELDGRDERNVGIWTLQPNTDTALNAPSGPLRINVHVKRSSPLAATWAKYTASYRSAWYSDENWPRYMLNSVLLVVLSVIGQLISCSMVAYAFSRLRWPGRDALFVVLLATIMLPGMVTMIPVFLIFKQLGWYNTLLPLWVPSFFGSAFFIFMLRQFMKVVPRELEEAALIDGCSWFGIYWRIMLPLMKPALTAVAIFTFMGVWNEFMGPLIYLSDQRQYPLSLGLFNFRSQYGSDFGMLMAASTMLTLPVIAVFFLMQRYFIQGVTLTGLKA